jgi:Zn finger protein HypA/HybF involved in hydrogenase expression
MRTIFDFIKEEEETPKVKTPIFLRCINCKSRFSPKVLEKTNGLCPNCHESYDKKTSNPASDIRVETPEEIKNWEMI